MTEYYILTDMDRGEVFAVVAYDEDYYESLRVNIEQALVEEYDTNLSVPQEIAIKLRLDADEGREMEFDISGHNLLLTKTYLYRWEQ